MPPPRDRAGLEPRATRRTRTRLQPGRVRCCAVVSRRLYIGCSALDLINGPVSDHNAPLAAQPPSHARPAGVVTHCSSS